MVLVPGWPGPDNFLQLYLKMLFNYNILKATVNNEKKVRMNKTHLRLFQINCLLANFYIYNCIGILHSLVFGELDIISDRQICIVSGNL